MKRFEMQAPEEWLEALDQWRVQIYDPKTYKSGVPSRAEAIRRLVDAALAAEKGRKP